MAIRLKLVRKKKTKQDNGGSWAICDNYAVICVSLIYVLLLLEDIVLVPTVLIASLGPDAWRWQYVHHVLCLLCVWAHLAAMLTDPGTLPTGADASAEEDGLELCRRCSAVRPFSCRAHHCSSCDKCIRKMDHHCTWINNCVGGGNQRHFLLFLVYVSLHCTWTLIALVHASGLCRVAAPPAHHDAFGFGAGSPEIVTLEVLAARSAGSDTLEQFVPNSASGCNPNEGHFAMAGAVGCAVALLFGLFAARALFDQVGNIIKNQTGIEQLQGAGTTAGSEPVRPVCDSLREVMGGPPTIRWLFPLPSRDSTGIWSSDKDHL